VWPLEGGRKPSFCHVAAQSAMVDVSPVEVACAGE
jgi:hypothetical protein